MKMYINIDQTLSQVSIDRFCRPGNRLLWDLPNIIKSIHDGGQSVACHADLIEAADYLSDAKKLSDDGITDEYEQSVNYLQQIIMDYLCEAELSELESTEYPEYE